MYNRGGDGVGCLEVKVGANAAELTNVIVAGPVRKRSGPYSYSPGTHTGADGLGHHMINLPINFEVPTSPVTEI